MMQIRFATFLLTSNVLGFPLPHTPPSPLYTFSIWFSHTFFCLISSLWGVWQRLIEEENMLAPSLKQFSLRVEMLPSYIPVRVAEKILFVGESVQMFENQNVNLTRKGKEHLFCSLCSVMSMTSIFQNAVLTNSSTVTDYWLILFRTYGWLCQDRAVVPVFCFWLIPKEWYKNRMSK